MRWRSSASGDQEHQSQSSKRTVERLDEKVAVLRDLERADRSAEDLDAEPLEDAHLVELNADVEGRLAAKGEEDAVGPLLLEDRSDIVGRDGQEVDLGREVVRGLDRRNVGVDENRLNVGLLQGLDGLRACEPTRRAGSALRTPTCRRV
jgi:hypothetical protein